MIVVTYTPHFLRQFNKLPPSLQDEVEENIILFQKDPQLPSLRVHKLDGRMKGCWSFFVNYRYRVVFSYDRKKEAALLAVGDHSVYDEPHFL